MSLAKLVGVGINALGLQNGRLTVASTEVYKSRRTTENAQTNNLNDLVTTLAGDGGFSTWATGNGVALPANYPYSNVSPQPATLQAVTITRTSTEFILDFDAVSLLAQAERQPIISFVNMANMLALNPEYDGLNDLDDSAEGHFDLTGEVYLEQNKAVFKVTGIAVSA